MTTQVNIAEAKAQLSRLVEAAVAGEEVVIAKAGTPVARLVPVHKPTKRELGWLPVTIPDEFFDPLGEDELAPWEGGQDE